MRNDDVIEPAHIQMPWSKWDFSNNIMDRLLNGRVFLRFSVALRIVLNAVLKTIENIDLLELVHIQLITECLREGPFALTTSKQCKFIRVLIEMFNEFERDLCMGLLDLLKTSIETINGFENNQDLCAVNIFTCSSHINWDLLFTSCLGMDGNSTSSSQYVNYWWRVPHFAQYIRWFFNLKINTRQIFSFKLSFLSFVFVQAFGDGIFFSF